MYELWKLAYLSLFDDYMQVTTFNWLKGTTPNHSVTNEVYLNLHMYQSPSAQSLYIIA
jgi:hypothetical protein